MIASGKSTLVKSLGTVYDLPIMEEFRKDDKVFDTLLGWLYEGVEDVEMLLQVYFLHKHYNEQLKHEGDVVVDRHIIEHWLFAQENLKEKPEVLNFYNGLFHQYMNKVIHPDIYVILSLSWETFVERIKGRGRPQEIENFDNNIEYFKGLHRDYEKKLKAQCEIYGIPYITINVDGKEKEETLMITKNKINEIYDDYVVYKP